MIYARKKLTGEWDLAVIQYHEGGLKFAGVAVGDAYVLVDEVRQFLSWLREARPEANVCDFFGLVEGNLTSNQRAVFSAVGRAMGLTVTDADAQLVQRVQFYAPTLEPYRIRAAELDRVLRAFESAEEWRNWPPAPVSEATRGLVMRRGQLVRVDDDNEELPGTGDVFLD